MTSDRSKWLLGGAVAAGGVWWLCRRRTPPGHAAETSFEAYMRSKDVRPGGAQPATKSYDPTDFSSYLKSRSGAGGTDASGAPAAPSEQQESAPLNAKPVLILFGTEFGFSKEVREREGNAAIGQAAAEIKKGSPPLHSVANCRRAADRRH